MSKSFETLTVTTKEATLSKNLTLKHTYINGAYRSTEIIRYYEASEENAQPKQTTTYLANNTLELQAIIELLQGGIEI